MLKSSSRWRHVVFYMFFFQKKIQGKKQFSGAPEFQRARRTEFPGAPGPARRRRLTTKKIFMKHDPKNRNIVSFLVIPKGNPT